MVYALPPNGGFGTYLSKDEQMDELLSEGWTLYLEHENGKKEVLATPKDGFLLSRPEIVHRSK